MKRNLPLTAAVAAALLLAAEQGWALPTGWREYQDYYLRRGRVTLMKFCALGGRLNSQGRYFWGGSTVARVSARLEAQDWDKETLRAHHSGLAAAMGQACPEVR